MARKPPVEPPGIAGIVGGILAALDAEDRKEFFRLEKKGMTPFDASQEMMKRIRQRRDEVTPQ